MYSITGIRRVALLDSKLLDFITAVDDRVGLEYIVSLCKYIFYGNQCDIMPHNVACVNILYYCLMKDNYPLNKLYIFDIKSGINSR